LPDLTLDLRNQQPAAVGAEEMRLAHCECGHVIRYRFDVIVVFTPCKLLPSLTSSGLGEMNLKTKRPVGLSVCQSV